MNTKSWIMPGEPSTDFPALRSRVGDMPSLFAGLLVERFAAFSLAYHNLGHITHGLDRLEPLFPQSRKS